MRHKIISMLIICAMLMGICNVSMAADSESKLGNLNPRDEKVIEFIDGMGFSEGVFEDVPSPEQTITRAQFAMLISHISGFTTPDAGEKFFEEILGDIDNSEVFISDNSSNQFKFNDVNESSPAYQYIKYVSSRGLMNGTSWKTFSPEKNITIEQILKPIVKVLKYEFAADVYGGYPKGYITVANELELLENVNQDISEEATVLSVYNLLYNTLNTAVFEQTSGEGENDEMLLTKNFDLEIIEGVITDNGISSLTGEGSAGEYGIKVGKKDMKLSEKSLWIRDYLGHKATVYYYNDDSDKVNTALFAQGYENERILKIKSEDYEGIENGNLIYYENGRLKRADLVPIPYVLVNGEAVSEYDYSMFDIDDGELTLISWENGKFDVILFDSYEYCLVDSVNTEREIIYNRLRTNEKDNLNVINLDDYDFVTIKNANDEYTTIQDISDNNLLEIKRGKRNISIKIAETNTTTITVKTIHNDDEGYKVIGDGEKDYRVSKKFQTALESVKITNGKQYKLYLNRNGEAVWVEGAVAEEDAELVAVLTQCAFFADEDSGENVYYVRVYSGKEEFEKYLFEEKINLNGDRVKIADYVNFIKKNEGSLIKLKLNEDKKIISLITPAEYGDRSDRGLYKMNVLGTKLNYRIDTSGFGTTFFRGSAPVFSVPEKAEQYNDIYAFGYNRASFTNNILYVVEGYTETLDKKVADFIIKRETLQAGGKFDTDALVIEDITATLSDDDISCYKLTGYYGEYQEAMSRKEYIIEDDAIFVDGNFKEIKDYTISDLKVGDIIRFAVNSKGNITTINMAYDCRGGITTGSNSSESSAHTIIGNAYALNDGYLTVATEILPEKINFADTSVQDKLKTYPLSNTKIVKVDTSSNKYKVSQGAPEDVVSYLNTRSAGAYSKVVVLAFYGYTPYLTIVYN